MGAAASSSTTARARSTAASASSVSRTAAPSRATATTSSMLSGPTSTGTVRRLAGPAIVDMAPSNCSGSLGIQRRHNARWSRLVEHRTRHPCTRGPARSVQRLVSKESSRMRLIPHTPVRAALIGALLTGSLVAASAALIPSSATSDGFDRSVVRQEERPHPVRLPCRHLRLAGPRRRHPGVVRHHELPGHRLHQRRRRRQDQRDRVDRAARPGRREGRGHPRLDRARQRRLLELLDPRHRQDRPGREQLRRAGHPGPQLVLAGLPRQHRLPRGHQDARSPASPSRPPTGRRRPWRSRPRASRS